MRILFLLIIISIHSTMAQFSCQQLPTQSICNSQSTLCYWNGSQCVNLPPSNSSNCEIYATSYLSGPMSTGKNFIEKILLINGVYTVVNEWSINTQTVTEGQGEGEVNVFNDIAYQAPNDIRVVTRHFFVKKLELIPGQPINITNSTYIMGLYDSALFADSTFFASGGPTFPQTRIFKVPLPAAQPITSIGDLIPGIALDAAKLNGRYYFVKVYGTTDASELGYINSSGKVTIIGQTKLNGGLGVRLTGLALSNGSLLGLGQDRKLYFVNSINAFVKHVGTLPSGKGKGFGLASSTESCK